MTMDGVQRTSWTLLAICVITALLPGGAKGVSTKGNEFYFAFMGNDRARMANDQNAILFVTTEEPNPVEVTVEVNPAFYENNPDLDRNRFPQSRTQTVVAGTSVTFNFSVSANVMQTGFPDHDIRVYDLSDLDRRSGIRVSTDGGQVSVYGINNELSSIDAFSVYPCQEYPTIPESDEDGERSYVYVVLSTSRVEVGRQSRLMVVGCQDRTNVTITPVSQLNSIPSDLPLELGAGETPSPNKPLSITIDRLQTYLLNNLEDLSGTRVVSDKPIALFGGHECARVPEATNYCAHLVQQIPPEPTWGDRFFIIPVPQRYSGEYYRAATIFSDTSLNVTCRTLGNPSPTTASYEVGNYDPRWGTGWIEFNTAAATSQETRNNEIQWCSVKSNHPILMMQYAQGNTVDARFKDADKRTFGDPFMTIIPPITQYANNFTVPTAKWLRALPLFPSITIAIPLGEFFHSSQQDQTKIRLNGEMVEPDEGWVEIYCSDNEVCGYGGRIESAPEGTVTVEHTSPEAGIGVWTYGIAASVSFGLTAGFRLDPIAFPNLEIVENVTVSESDVEAIVRIRRIGDITRGGSRFNLRIEDGGATRGVDYRDYTVDPSDSIRRVIDADTNEIGISMGTEEVILRFPIVNDTINEGTEKFFLHITPIRRINVVLTPLGTVTILNSEPPTIPMPSSSSIPIIQPTPTPTPVLPPPRPDITNVLLLRRDDLQIKWGLPDGVDFTKQPVDNYRVEVRCVGRVDSDSVTASELLRDSVEYQNANTSNTTTKFPFPDVELRNKTYLIRVCAVSSVGETCSGYKIFTPPLPPQPVITSVSVVNDNDIILIDVKWRLPDGIIQPVDSYRVEVRCVGGVDSESLTELLDDSMECHSANTTNTEVLFPVVELRNRTYLIRVFAQNGAGESCSEHKIFTPPVPEIISVSLVGNDLDVKWRLPDGAMQSVDNYTVKVRCVGRVDSQSVTVLELLSDSVEYRNALTGNLELTVSNITLRNKTYLIRVCALSDVGETCSGYEIFTPLLPPRPEITSVSLVDGNDLDVKWRIPDRVVQPVDNYRVDVRCVGRVDSESVTALELLRDSVEYRNALTGNLELKVSDIALRNKTYLIRVCALSVVGETCSGYEIFTPPLPPQPEIPSVPLAPDSSNLPPGIIAVIVILVMLGYFCCWLWLLILFCCYHERQGITSLARKVQETEEGGSEDFKVDKAEKT